MIRCPNVSLTERLTDLQWEESIALQQTREAHREACDLLGRHLRGEDNIRLMDVQIAQIGAKLAGMRWKAIRTAHQTLAKAA